MDELTRTLLVGTAQTSGAAVPAPATAVEAIVVAAAIDAPRERQLLLRAGAQAVYRRAGRLPLVAPPASVRPAAAADEPRRITSPALTALLQPLFAERQLTVLPEALALLAEHGLVLAPELLPDALDLPDAGLRKPLLAVIGERGRWLAAQVPRWRWATVLAAGDRLPDDADARFEEGSAETRLALFALARRVDPERARKWITAAWSEEKADQRAAFLETFAAQLTLADEPFLDAALGDRSGQVRPIAARLLWRLPGSALSQRMLARADALVRLQPGLPRATGIMGRVKAAFAGAPTAPVALEVDLPAERFDPAWGKDGVLEPPPQGTGRRQWWLAQLMAAVPPTHWQERLGLAPDAFVAAARAHELGDVLVDGLAAATLRFLPAAHAFLVPLWNAMRARAGPSLLLPRPLESLLAAMSPEERERCALAIFSADSPGIDPSLLLALPRPWPSSVADAFIDSGAYTPAGARGWHGHLLSEAALAFPRSHLGFQLPVPPDANAYLRRSFDDFQSTLELRRRLHEEILRDPTYPETQRAVLRAHAEELHAEELAALARADDRPRPPGWRLSPWAVRTYVLGGTLPDGLAITPKYVGHARLIETAIATLATDRALLLYGVPGTAKSWVSEHLAAAISGTSTLLVQGTAGTDESAIRYGWNYARLISEGPSEAALVPGPVFRAMRDGQIARLEELTRIPSEVQDTLISILSEKNLPIPELGIEILAQRGFNVIATANNRDRGVNELSSALLRRFNTVVLPLPDTLDEEVSIVERRVTEMGRALALPAEKPALEAIRRVVTVFRELRDGKTVDGKTKLKSPSGTLSTAEAIGVVTHGLTMAAFYGDGVLHAADLAASMSGAIVKDPVQDRLVLQEYLQTVVKERDGWKDLYRAMNEVL